MIRAYIKSISSREARYTESISVGSATNWWERSANSSNNFANVNNNGTANNNNASNANGVAPFGYIIRGQKSSESEISPKLFDTGRCFSGFGV